MRTPQGFEPQKHPLRHKMYYAAGLSVTTTGKNSVMFTVIRNYKGAVNATFFSIASFQNFTNRNLPQYQ